MNSTRYRVQHKFWLDLKKEEEDRLDEWLHSLKRGRQFVSTLRDALRLFFDLKDGKTEVLLELFPFVSEQRQLQQQLARLETLIQQSAPQPLVSGPKPLTSLPKALPRPIEGDDDDLLVIGRDTTTDSSLNFLNSMMNLQQ